MSTAEKAADTILDLIACAPQYSRFGLRADARALAPGAALGNSWHEGQDGIVAELDGACCFECSAHGVEIALSQAMEYAAGKTDIYLIAGHSRNAGVLVADTEDAYGEMVPAGAEWGMQEGENGICIPSAVVIGKI
jgi:hypothetical protein